MLKGWRGQTRHRSVNRPVNPPVRRGGARIRGEGAGGAVPEDPPASRRARAGGRGRHGGRDAPDGGGPDRPAADRTGGRSARDRRGPLAADEPDAPAPPRAPAPTGPAGGSHGNRRAERATAPVEEPSPACKARAVRNARSTALHRAGPPATRAATGPRPHPAAARRRRAGRRSRACLAFSRRTP
jgi:hypothetical protein